MCGPDPLDPMGTPAIHWQSANMGYLSACRRRLRLPRSARVWECRTTRSRTRTSLLLCISIFIWPNNIATHRTRPYLPQRVYWYYSICHKYTYIVTGPARSPYIHPCVPLWQSPSDSHASNVGEYYVTKQTTFTQANEKHIPAHLHTEPQPDLAIQQ